ncbi:MAG: FtsQ-type POTRA domain-containing protein [Elusimicrobia bacterium]|nr:FtsQ-type POTRA domain-containing protein [Elusimicrobiota bacterium]
MIKRKKRKIYAYKRKKRKATTLNVSFRPGAGSIKAFKTVLKIAIFGALVYGAYYTLGQLHRLALESPHFVIREIAVSGTGNVTRTEIRKLLPFTEGDNLINIDTRSTAREIKALKKELRDIRISRRWQKVYIRLYERTPEAFIIENGELMGLDFDNTPFPLRGFMYRYQVPKFLYNTLSERDTLLAFLRALQKNSASFAGDILSISLNRTGNITITMRDGTAILWGEANFDSLSHKVKITKQVYAHALLQHGALKHINMQFYEYGRAIVMPGLRVAAQ